MAKTWSPAKTRLRRVDEQAIILLVKTEYTVLWTPEVTKIVLNKIILNVWIGTGPMHYYNMV
jgi:hypothetical protein